jgi:uncharacterized repeat protein (TIGR03803 family)
MTSTGAVTTLYSFASPGDTLSALVQGRDGNFYGTTSTGGTSNVGTVFRITAQGALTTLLSFDTTDGATPYSGVFQGTDGNFYGTTYAGGKNGYGTIFKMSANGTLTTLHNFDGTDGSNPTSAPMQSTNGTFYGTAGSNWGTVFSLSMKLGPFVETNPTSGRVGTKVTILGNNLAGATNVTFNGTKATFKASGTYITTTVPTGASTGTVEVVTHSQTLKSNVPFRVP